MFTLHEVDVAPLRSEPARLPLTVLTIADYEHERVFDVEDAVRTLMGGAEWEKATRVIRPIASSVRGFVGAEIVYFVDAPGRFELEELSVRGTRLLILQSEADELRALAYQVASEGGPATIVVHGGTPEGLRAYYLDLFANIVHNLPLREVVKPQEREGAPDVEAFFGRGADHLLQFDRWLDEITYKIDRAQTGERELLNDFAAGNESRLHARDRERLRSKMRERLGTPDIDALTKLRNEISFVRETRGVLPLNELAENAPALDDAARAFDEARTHYPDLAKEIANDAKALAENAPRVLNANFADPQSRELVKPWRELAQTTSYELLVDVGPRWSHIPSIVTGNEVFPEQALPPSDDGWRVQVILFSDDFAEETTKAEMWVPARSGRSFPMIDGVRAASAGPIALPVRTPDHKGPWRGRLSLYYENNLLQSAVVSVNVPGRSHSIDVDFVLSGDFADLGHHAARKLGERRFPVGVNIAMNDDGGGAHRLMIVGRDDLTVRRPYDPKATEGILVTSRQKLKECFSEHDASCRVPADELQRKPGLDAQNGKSLKEFKCDLFQLAWYGADLFTEAFGQISSPNLIQYIQKVRAALKSRTVIQVARTSHAQYVYPWAMVYDIPLPNRGIPGKLRNCKVIAEEWGSDGRRNAPMADRCPHDEEPDHQQDMLCPYGFWGLKHFIEQPINVISADSPRTAASAVPFSKPVSLGLGITRDAALDAAALQKHVDAIGKLAPLSPNDGADDWDDVQLMLAQPDIAYFLVHGEWDAQRAAPYLGVGPRNSDAKYRVYPSELMQWATTQKDFWDGRRPLIFINGCHTANLAPGEVLSFVSTFANFGASAVIGTEISIRLPLAAEVAEKLLRRILNGEAIGEVIHSLRWELANKGNLLGLAYVPYCLSDLRFR